MEYVLKIDTRTQEPSLFSVETGNIADYIKKVYNSEVEKLKIANVKVLEKLLTNKDAYILLDTPEKDKIEIRPLYPKIIKKQTIPFKFTVEFECDEEEESLDVALKFASKNLEGYKNKIDDLLSPLGLKITKGSFGINESKLPEKFQSKNNSEEKYVSPSTKPISNLEALFANTTQTTSEPKACPSPIHPAASNKNVEQKKEIQQKKVKEKKETKGTKEPQKTMLSSNGDDTVVYSKDEFNKVYGSLNHKKDILNKNNAQKNLDSLSNSNVTRKEVLVADKNTDSVKVATKVLDKTDVEEKHENKENKKKKNDEIYRLDLDSLEKNLEKNRDNKISNSSRKSNFEELEKRMNEDQKKYSEKDSISRFSPTENSDFQTSIMKPQYFDDKDSVDELGNETLAFKFAEKKPANKDEAFLTYLGKNTLKDELSSKTKETASKKKKRGLFGRKKDRCDEQRY